MWKEILIIFLLVHATDVAMPLLRISPLATIVGTIFCLGGVSMISTNPILRWTWFIVALGCVFIAKVYRYYHDEDRSKMRVHACKDMNAILRMDRKIIIFNKIKVISEKMKNIALNIRILAGTHKDSSSLRYVIQENKEWFEKLEHDYDALCAEFDSLS
jgi:hypothetical protein